MLIEAEKVGPTATVTPFPADSIQIPTTNNRLVSESIFLPSNYNLSVTIIHNINMKAVPIR